ncbi:hypothetical protein [Allocoleopsis franciscana]|uniref:hypothetical protein n=1 Tax=Allocoleopsis franciscana TaxID=2886352 RepID=UPI00030A2246|nr:hypothetical protein [Allocoleopsis franciscana]
MKGTSADFLKLKRLRFSYWDWNTSDLYSGFLRSLRDQLLLPTNHQQRTETQV